MRSNLHPIVVRIEDVAHHDRSIDATPYDEYLSDLNEVNLFSKAYSSGHLLAGSETRKSNQDCRNFTKEKSTLDTSHN